jgi:ABC-type Fe3+-siderophore transport system permease subunit
MSTVEYAIAAHRPIRVRLALTFAGFGAFAVAVCILAPLVGSTSISLARVFDRSIPFADNVDAQIFFVARMPRVLAAAAVGATLASAGVVLQAMLRNPLATPFTLGVSAGASSAPRWHRPSSIGWRPCRDMRCLRPCCCSPESR